MTTISLGLTQFLRWRAMRQRRDEIARYFEWQQRRRVPYSEWQPTAMLLAEVTRDLDAATNTLRLHHPVLATIAGFLVYPELL